MENKNKNNLIPNHITNHKHWGLGLLAGLSLLVLAGSILAYSFTNSANAQVISGDDGFDISSTYPSAGATFPISMSVDNQTIQPGDPVQVGASQMQIKIPVSSLEGKMIEFGGQAYEWNQLSYWVGIGDPDSSDRTWYHIQTMHRDFLTGIDSNYYTLRWIPGYYDAVDRPYPESPSGDMGELIPNFYNSNDVVLVADLMHNGARLTPHPLLPGDEIFYSWTPRFALGDLVITSPNVGETWNIGETQNIGIKLANISPSFAEIIVEGYVCRVSDGTSCTAYTHLNFFEPIVREPNVYTKTYNLTWDRVGYDLNGDLIYDSSWNEGIYLALTVKVGDLPAEGGYISEDVAITNISDITIDLPAGGETWELGSIQTINWTLSDSVSLPNDIWLQAKYRIDGTGEGTVMDHITTEYINVTSRTGSFDWKVGYTQQDGTWELMNFPIDWDNPTHAGRVDFAAYGFLQGAVLSSNMDDTSGWFDITPKNMEASIHWSMTPESTSRTSTPNVGDTLTGRFSVAPSEVEVGSALIDVMYDGNKINISDTVSPTNSVTLGSCYAGVAEIAKVERFETVQNNAIQVTVNFADGLTEKNTACSLIDIDWEIIEEGNSDVVVRMGESFTSKVYGRYGEGDVLNYVDPVWAVNVNDPLIVVTAPVEGDTWYVGETKNIEFNLTREITDSINIEFVLCQADPGLCWDGEWLEPVIINPEDGLGPFTDAWVVGTRLDGTPIPDIGTAGFVDNALISLYATGTDVGLSGKNFDSGVFSIEESSISTITVEDPEATDIYSNAWVLDTNETIDFSVSEPIPTDTKFAIYLGVKKPLLISWLDKISQGWRSTIKESQAFTLVELLVTQLIIKMAVLQLEFVDYNMVPIGYLEATADGVTTDYTYDWLVGDVIDAEGSTTNADKLAGWLVNPYNDSKIFVSALDNEYNLASSDEFQIALEASQGLAGVYTSASMPITQPIESLTSSSVSWGFDEGYGPDPMLVGGGNIVVSMALLDESGSYIDLDNVTEPGHFYSIFTNAPIDPAITDISRLNAASNLGDAVAVQFAVAMNTPDWNITRPYFESLSMSYDSTSTPRIAINFTLPVQVPSGATPKATTDSILYLYTNEADEVYSFATSTGHEIDWNTELNMYSGTTHIPVDRVEPNTTYTVFAKTPQYISKRANEDITMPSVLNGGETFEITFPELKAGDISGVDPYDVFGFGSRDDDVNSSDISRFSENFGNTEPMFGDLGDFDNNGSINSLDIWPFAKSLENFFLRGDLGELLTPPQ